MFPSINNQGLVRLSTHYHGHDRNYIDTGTQQLAFDYTLLFISCTIMPSAIYASFI